MPSTAALARSSATNRGRSLLLVIVGVLALSGFQAAATPTAFAADTAMSVNASGDATVRRAYRFRNFGVDSILKSRRYRAQTFISFDLQSWTGRAVGQFDLELSVTSGDASTLRVMPAVSGWSETEITWATKPVTNTARVFAGATAGTGTVRISLLALLGDGVVDADQLSVRVDTATTAPVKFSSRESGLGPRLVMAEQAPAETLSVRSPSYTRFYTPNISASGDKATPDDQLRRLFSDAATAGPVLESVDVYSFFGASLSRNNPAYDDMVRRAIPLLAKYQVKLGLEVGGPLGYAPGVVYGGDTGGENGRKSAAYDVNNLVGKIEGMGGRVDYLMLDGALRRTIRNGLHKQSHKAFLTIGLVSARNALTYRSTGAGSAGNSIRVGYVVDGPNSPLSVRVSARDITVALATDSAGRAVSTAAQIKAAVEASSAAMALVTISHEGTSDGTGQVGARSLGALAWGDDGLNMSVADSVAEVVAYVRAVNLARPNIRFVLIEDVILWPFDGKAGYASVAYPGEQRPDFKAAWNELVQQLRNAGLMRFLVGFHNDVPVEYLDRQVPSINKNADDWYGRIFKQQAQVEAAGVAFGQHFNSLFGGSPSVSNLASNSYFQSQVLHHVRQLESYRLDRRSDLDQGDHFTLDAFMYYPRVISPWSTDYSTDDTYLDALRLYRNLGGQTTATSP